MGGVPVPVVVADSSAGAFVDDLPNVTLSGIEGTALVEGAGGASTRSSTQAWSSAAAGFSSC